jgi:hypothetical protein
MPTIDQQYLPEDQVPPVYPPQQFSVPSPWTSMSDLNEIWRQAPSNNVGNGATGTWQPSPQENVNQQNLQSPSDTPEMDPWVMGGFGGSGSRSIPADMGAINQLIGQMDGKNLEGVQLQKEQIEKLKQYRDKMPEGSGGMDLTGLMSLADAWGGPSNHFAQTYKRPDTADERAAKKAAVDLQIAGQGGKLTDDELGILKDKLSGEIAKLHYGQIKSAQNSNDMDKFGERIVNKYNADKQVQKSLQVEGAADTVLGLLASNDPIAHQSIPTYMARLSGEVGNLSEADKRPFGGSNAFEARWAQSLENMKSGTLTDENKAFLRDLTVTLRQKAGDAKLNRAQQLSEQYGRVHQGVNPQQIFGLLAPGTPYEKMKPLARSSQKSSSSAFNDGDQQQKDGWVWERQGGKWKAIKQVGGPNAQ